MRLSRRFRPRYLVIQLSRVFVAYIAIIATFLLNFQGLPRYVALLISAALIVSSILGSRVLTSTKPATKPRRNFQAAVGNKIRPAPVTFRGRTSELNLLVRLHNEGRSAREAVEAQPGVEVSTAGPVVLLIHGMPGVGKSVLAHELARAIAREYPDGHLYTNLGRAGRSRSSSQVTRSLLEQLGFDLAKIPQGLETKIFRSATAASRLLIVLDAARDPDQVQGALPSGPGNVVIITGRRNLGPSLQTPSFKLNVPSEEDAFSIWSAAARSKETGDLGATADIIESCGRLPIAIRAAATYIGQGVSPAVLADQLRPPATRLERLSVHGWSAESKILSEYSRLTADEQRALRYLSVIESETFVPWSLTALIESTSLADAEAVLAQLSAAQLVDSVAQDVLLDLDRYAMHTLVRSFGYRELILTEGREEALAAISRLENAYARVADRVLEEIDSDHKSDPSPATETITLPGSAMTKGIASFPQQWVRAEGSTILRAVDAAFRQDRYDLCWRIAVQCGEVVPRQLSVSEGKRLFETALRASRHEGDRARLAVMTAFGQYLAGAGALGEATTVLQSCIKEANSLRAVPEFGALGTEKEAEACMVLGTGLLQAGFLRQASSYLLRAKELALVSRQSWLVSRARAAWSLTFNKFDQVTVPSVTDAVQDARIDLWSSLAMIDRAVDARQWDSACGDLRSLRTRYEGDLGAYLYISVRLAEILLDGWLDVVEAQKAVANRTAGTDSTVDVVHTALNALYEFDVTARRRSIEAAHVAAAAGNLAKRTGNRVIEVRLLCILARALCAHGELAGALPVHDLINQRFGELDKEDVPRTSVIEAQVLWAGAEYDLAADRDMRGAAVGMLLRAERIAVAEGDARLASSLRRRIVLYGRGEVQVLPPLVEKFVHPVAEVVVDGDQCIVGVPFTINFTIETNQRDEASSRIAPLFQDVDLTVCLTADGAVCEPSSQRLVGSSDGALPALRFTVTPKVTGQLEIKIRVLSGGGRLIFDLSADLEIASALSDVKVV